MFYLLYFLVALVYGALEEFADTSIVSSSTLVATKERMRDLGSSTSDLNLALGVEEGGIAFNPSFQEAQALGVEVERVDLTSAQEVSLNIDPKQGTEGINAGSRVRPRFAVVEPPESRFVPVGPAKVRIPHEPFRSSLMAQAQASHKLVAQCASELAADWCDKNNDMFQAIVKKVWCVAPANVSQTTVSDCVRRSLSGLGLVARDAVHFADLLNSNLLKHAILVMQTAVMALPSVIDQDLSSVNSRVTDFYHSIAERLAAQADRWAERVSTNEVTFDDFLEKPFNALSDLLRRKKVGLEAVDGDESETVGTSEEIQKMKAVMAVIQKIMPLGKMGLNAVAKGSTTGMEEFRNNGGRHWLKSLFCCIGQCLKTTGSDLMENFGDYATLTEEVVEAVVHADDTVHGREEVDAAPPPLTGEFPQKTAETMTILANQSEKMGRMQLFLGYAMNAEYGLIPGDKHSERIRYLAEVAQFFSLKMIEDADTKPSIQVAQDLVRQIRENGSSHLHVPLMAMTAGCFSFSQVSFAAHWKAFKTPPHASDVCPSVLLQPIVPESSPLVEAY
ncbi:MAG: hypothetical protein OXC30_05985 [Alphaproteobacteria bacterium]|nr:hypothetical protein [Alphaproteobacteria bacterium]